ncbi:MAG: hypothetical protein ACPGVZ_20295 [Myxococcota bacterium]
MSAAQTPERLGAPGALLVLLCRGVTSTRVVVRVQEGAETPFACETARPGVGQWDLAEGLCAVTWANEVSRLYATTLTVMVDGGRVGVFVGFLDDGADDAPPPPFHEWRDLREAARELAAPWGLLLGDVRARFVAQSPDEALRVR